MRPRGTVRASRAPRGSARRGSSCPRPLPRTRRPAALAPQSPARTRRAGRREDAPARAAPSSPPPQTPPHVHGEAFALPRQDAEVGYANAMCLARRRGGRTPNVLELYQAEWCPYSHRARQRLTELGVEFVARQVEADPDERRALGRLALRLGRPGRRGRRPGAGRARGAAPAARAGPPG